MDFSYFDEKLFMLQRLLFFCVCFFVLSSVSAIDVNAILNSKNSNDEKLEQIVKELADKKNATQKALIIEPALTFFVKEKHAEGISVLNYYKASQVFDEANYELTINLLDGPIKHFIKTKNKLREAKCYRLLGLSKAMIGNFEPALKDLFAAQKIFEAEKSDLDLSICYNGLAVVYYYNNQFNKAIEYWQKGMEVDKSMLPENKLLSVGNIGLAYMDLQNFKEAKRAFDKALSIAKQTGNKEYESNASTNLSKYYAETKNYKEAIRYSLISLEYHKQLNQTNKILKDYSNLTEIYRRIRDLKSAKKYAELTIELSHQTNNLIELYTAYKNVSVIYHELKLYERAWEIRDTADNIQDSMFTEESFNKISAIEKKFELDKKQTEIELLNKDKKIKEAELSKTKSLTVFFSIFAIAVVLFSLFLLRANRQKNLANNLLVQRNDEIAAKNEELNQQNEEITAQRDEIENQKHLVEEKNKDITDSIKYAKRLQDAILTPDELIKQIVPDSFVLFKPKDILSGDFYWFDEIGDKIYFSAVDCTGHGVPGAFMSIVGYNLLKHAIHEHSKVWPHEILDQANIDLSRSLQQTYQESQVKDGMDLSLCCIDKKTKTLYYSGANNCIYVITNINHNPEMKELKADKQPVGVFLGETSSPFTLQTFQLKEGDTVYLFTDGFADQFGGPKGKKFKYKQFEDLLYSICELPIEKQKLALNNVFEHWKGFSEQTDDVLIIGVKV